MAIITLTTDMGISDSYVAIIKGNILKLNSDAQIIDISHNIEKYNIQQAAYVLKHSYKNFPQESIHIIGVDTDLTVESAHVAIKKDGHYFIGNDNGIFALMFDEFPKEIIELPMDDEEDFQSFPSKSLYVRAAIAIANHQQFSSIGFPRTHLNEKLNLKPVSHPDAIRGYVIHVDSYGNIICNINKDLFEKTQKGRPFLISFRNTNRNVDRDGYGMKHIAKSYNEAGEVQLVSIFNSFGLLEIALNKANANKLLGVGLNDMINIDFYDS